MPKGAGLVRRLVVALIVPGITALSLLVWQWPRYPYAEPASAHFTAARVGTRPLLRSDMAPAASGILSKHGYVNINGATVIRVPPWVEKPLGR